MDKKSCKFISVITAVFMLLMVFVTPLPAVAANDTVIKWSEGVTGGVIYFDKVTGAITDYEGDITKVNIPEKIQGYDVISIGNRAFNYCGSLISITIPDSITSIEMWAFDGCYSLTNITIPQNVTNIEPLALWGCKSLTNITVDERNKNYCSENGVLYNKEKNSLIQYPIGNARTSFNIPSGVEIVENSAFLGCDSLTNITIPNSVISIKWNAFFDCDSLTSITIPKSVTSIESTSFGSCNSLTNIIVDDQNENYSSENGVLYNKEESSLIQYPIGNARTFFDVPASVTSIGDRAFSYSKLKSITLQDGVTSIGDGAFYYCDSLISITIPDTVTSIGSEAFYYCDSLRSIVIPDGITSIEYHTFSCCDSLTSITIPDTVTSIGPYSFDFCPYLTIYGYPGSYAETYARENNIPFNVTGDDSEDDYAVCTSVELDADKLAILTTDSPVKLTAKCYPENAVNKDIVWTSLNPGVVTVDSDGNIKAKNISSRYQVGTIRAENPATGCFDEVKVHVYNPAKMKNDFSGIKNAAILTKYKIPDLNAGYCPQGLCMNNKYVFISAYNEKKEYTSAIYIFNRNTGELLNKAYLDTVSHVGGIAYDPVSKYIVVCANESLTKKLSEKKKLNFYTVDRLLNAKTWCPKANYKRTIDFTGSFVTAYDGKIWVGNFNKKKSTPLKTYKYNKATKKYVFVKKYTMKIKSVQGICFAPNGQMLVSVSSGREYSSKLYKAKKSLTGYKATHRAYIPNLSQNIVCNKTNGTTYTYVLYESAYNKYMYDSSQKSLRPVDKVMRLNYNKIKWTKL